MQEGALTRVGHTVAPVSAPWADSVTPVPPPASTVPHTSNLVYAGVVTGAWSGLLSLALYGVGRLLGVPFEVMMSDTQDSFSM